MQFFYNGFAVHGIGECTVSQSREAVSEGDADAPQRMKVTLRLGVDLFEDSFADNYALLREFKVALQNPQGLFRWHDEDLQRDYLNQTVTIASDDLPEDPNGWGEYHQRLNVVFSYYEDLSGQDLLPLTVARAGSGGGQRLDRVTSWTETVAQDRFSAMHGQRRMSQGKLSASGVILADAKQPVAARRTQLLQKKKALEQLEGAECAVVYGAAGEVFNRTVRVDEFSAKIDQAVYSIGWSFTAHYTRMPDETDYATVEWQAEQRDNNSGEQFLTVTGKVVASSEAKANTKVEALVAAALKQYGYDAGQQLRNDRTPSAVDANADGQAFIELNFAVEYRRWRTDNLGATFERSGGGEPVSFGNVRTWTQGYEARRFNELRSQRQHAGGRVDASGTLKGDMTLPLDQRRAALVAQQQAMEAEANNADGVLRYGSFNQVVRVENLRAEINQAITGIDWSFTAVYSMFPNEGGYATVEMTAAHRESEEDGEEFLTLSGRIQAPDETLARAKLDAVRTAVLKNYGFSLAQRLRTEATPNRVFANGDKTAGLEAEEQSDGTTFTELTFAEEYRRRKSDLLGWNLRVNTRDDAPSGQTLTSYSGFVLASGDTADAAYAVALDKAQKLGSGKEALVGADAFLKGSTINWEQRQTRKDNAVEFVRLEFGFEYQAKSGRMIYAEVTSETTLDAFGMDVESVSGFIVTPSKTSAGDASATATAVYADLKAPYNGRLMRNERTVQAQVKTGPGTGASLTQAQLGRFEFSFQVYRLKSTVAYKYGISVARDFLALDMQSRVHGSAFAKDTATASAAVDALVAGMALGSQVRSDRNEDREYLAGAADVLVKLDFDESFTTALKGVSGLLEMSVNEEVQYSGDAWVVQATIKNQDGSGGFAVPQSLSVAAGSRTVRGSATAGDRATAEAWGKKQRVLLTGDKDGVSSVQPERWEFGYELVPRIEGVVKGAGQNVRLFRVGFTFAEILPNYPAT